MLMQALASVQPVGQPPVAVVSAAPVVAPGAPGPPGAERDVCRPAFLTRALRCPSSFGRVGACCVTAPGLGRAARLEPFMLSRFPSPGATWRWPQPATFRLAPAFAQIHRQTHPGNSTESSPGNPTARHARCRPTRWRATPSSCSAANLGDTLSGMPGVAASNFGPMPAGR